MLLACLGGILFSVSAIAASSPKMSGAEASRAQEANYDPAGIAEDEMQPPPGMADEEDLEEDAVNVARRAVRRYPEESQGLFTGRQGMPITRLSCDCPEVLTKGTLAAIVAALAFLGFFSTSVLLVLSVWVLRLVGKQKKTENSDSTKPVPPVPPPRPEHTYAHPSGHPRRSPRIYETLHPAHSSAAEGVYLTADEINPGPRIRREQSYGSPSRRSPGTKSSPENEYVGPGRPPLPPPLTPPQGIYSSFRERSAGSKMASPSGSPGFRAGSPSYPSGSPAFHAGSPSYPSGSPAFHAGSPSYPSGSPAFHAGSPALPSGSPVGSPGSPVGSPSGTKGRKRGADEPIYEEVN